MANIQDFIISFVLPQLQDYRIGSEELVAESPFLENDVNRHFSISLETGLWQCFKSHRKGNLQHLMMHFNKCSYEKADEFISLKLFKTKYSSRAFADYKLPLPYTPPKPATKSLEDIIIDAQMRKFNYSTRTGAEDRAVQYVTQRKLNPDDFWLAHKGIYTDRLIIPYYKKSTMFFFQARALYDFQTPKYLTPPSESCVKSSDVLYPFNWNDKELIVCEGPIDAISLQSIGINATCTQGSYVSRTQFDILYQFKGDIIFGYDSDDAGVKGIESFLNHQVITGRKSCFFYVFPVTKDWNQDLVEGKDIRYRIESTMTVYDQFSCLRRSLEGIQERG